MALATPKPADPTIERSLSVSIKLDQREVGAYSNTTIAEATVVAPFPLDMEQTHQAIADTLGLLIRNTDATHGVIVREVELPPAAARARIESEATVTDPNPEPAQLDELPF